METKPGKGDSSTRFLKFLLGYPGMKSLYPLRSIPAFLDTNKTFFHKCMSKDEDYLTEIQKPVYQGGPYGLELPTVHRIKRVFPPKLSTQKDRKAMQSLFEDSDANIVFPAILEKKENICENSNDTLKHSYCLVYRKHVDEAIILDDLYLPNHSKFAYKWIAQNHAKGKKAAPFALQMFVKPYIKSWIGNTNVMFHVPMLSEATFTQVLKVLDGKNKTLRNVYRGFIVLYTDFMVQNPEVPHKEIEKQVSQRLRMQPTLILDAIERLQRHNEAFFRAHKATMLVNGTWVNLETRKEVRHPSRSSESPLHMRVVPMYTVRNSASIGAVNKSSLDILKFLEFKHRNSRVLRAIWDIEEYPEVEYDEEFEENMNEALRNPNIHFICIYLSMVPTSYEEEDANKHANVIIYDKKRNVLERFEPNTRAYLEDHPEYDEVLNDAVLRMPFFDNPQFVQTVDICPISPHAEEGKEFKELFQYHGGSCALWTAWYIDLRLSNPMEEPSKILKYAIHYIQHQGSFKVFINAYRAYLKKGVDMMRHVSSTRSIKKNSAQAPSVSVASSRRATAG